jgi:hypothetical protein
MGKSEGKSESTVGQSRSESSESSKESTKGEMKASQSEHSGAMKNERAEDHAKSGDTKQRAEDRAKGTETNQRAEDRTKGTETKQRAEERNKGTETRQRAEERTKGGDTNVKAEGKNGTNSAQTNTTERSQTTGQAGAGAKLTSEQRTKITSVIHSQHFQSVNNVNFSLSVGTRVPREGVHFYPLPSEVVTIYPQWRGYEYIVVKDRIVIIDPNSYEIVEIIES